MDPTQLKFNEKLLRPHLLKCLETRQIQPFPLVHSDENKSKRPDCLRNIKVVDCCGCFKVLYQKDQRQCGVCKLYYHTHCTVLVEICKIIQCANCLDLAVNGRVH